MRRLLVAKFSRKTAQDAVPPGGLSLESPNLTGPDLYPSGLIFWPPDSTILTAVLLKPHVVDVSVPALGWALSNRVYRRQRRRCLPGLRRKEFRTDFGAPSIVCLNAVSSFECA